MSQIGGESTETRSLWSLDPSVTFLNHGSFGACPEEVQLEQGKLREQMESEPVRFFEREAPALLKRAKRRLGEFVGADAQDLAFVPNATTGVNAVLRSLDMGPGDEILVTEYAYGACRNAAEFAANRMGASVKVVRTPFLGATPQSLKASVLEGVNPATRLVLLDHITSPTGLVFPVGEIVEALNEMGVDCLVDGAHAPGMVPLDLSLLNAAYYVGNLHKWVCAPKGAAFLHVRKDRQPAIRPLVISHGATLPVGEYSRFELEFDWTGTDDPSSFLVVPATLDYMSQLLEGGWSALMEGNHRKVVKARSILCDSLGIEEPCSTDVLGSLAAVPLPVDFAGCEVSVEGARALQDRLFFEFDIEVPVIYWPTLPTLLIRVSAQIYNCVEEYEKLAQALAAMGP